METYVICGDEQDSKHYELYYISTAFYEIMGVMSEYFIRITCCRNPQPNEDYLMYLIKTTQYVT